jgi:hypothetical protein
VPEDNACSSVQGQGTLYIVVDALGDDGESPNSSGPDDRSPPRREQVLTILKELIELNLPLFDTREYPLSSVVTE